MAVSASFGSLNFEAPDWIHEPCLIAERIFKRVRKKEGYSAESAGDADSLLGYEHL
jgi:hypothetical protein